MTQNAHILTSSEGEIANQFFKLADAGASLIQIRSREVMRTADTIRREVLLEEAIYSHVEWDCINGTRRFTKENYTNALIQGQETDFDTAIKEPLRLLRDKTSQLHSEPDRTHVFVFVDAEPYIRDNPHYITLMQQYASILPASNACIVFITPDGTDMGYLPLGTMLLAEMATPNVAELRDYLDTLLGNVDSGSWDRPPEISEEEKDRLCHLGLGMSRQEFETHVSISFVEQSLAGDPCIHSDALFSAVAKGKTEVVKQSDILELFPALNMEDVGGMHRLKDWIGDRRASFSDEAKEFGVEAPRGLAIVGMPGGGKSLVAKAIAGSLGVPLIRLDFGRVFSKFVGDSERRMRAALTMVEQMDQVVLFADEIDKGLGGISSGSGDGGVSSRVLGAFLTWMQENKSKVLVIMTANRIEALPPELFRRGRLDAVFSVGLPTPSERREVLAVHLRKRGRSIEDFTATQLLQFDAATDNYLAAEIEAGVKDALVLAYNDDKAKDVEMRHLTHAYSEMVPMSKSHASQIQAIAEWAAKHATPVNYTSEELAKRQGHSVEETAVVRQIRQRAPRTTPSTRK